MDQIARSPRQTGAALRRRRRALNLTQQELGDKTTLRQATVSSIENGEPGTRLGTLFDIVAALDLEIVIRPRTGSTSDQGAATAADSGDER